MEDEYRTIRKPSRAEIKVKGSRFIGETFLVVSAETAADQLHVVRKREHAATHHCWARRTGIGDEAAFKYSDDGEPSGTAGKPIYDVLCGADVTNTLLVVTRYFGGTKLGTGGLARAYTEAAQAVMRSSGTVTRHFMTRFRLSLDFSLYDQWMRQVSALEASVEDTEYTDHVTMTVAVRRSRAEKLREVFIELSSGKGTVEEITG
jgi:uncharacterized YigZ family protein